MKREEIIENNKMIAEFMGYKYFPFDPEQRYNNDYNPIGWRKPITGHLKIRGWYLCRKHNELDYDRSWDWLMPCWKKIASDVFDNRGKLTDDEYITAHRLTKQMLDAFQKTELKSAWEVLVEFIKWYNEKKQKNEQ